MLAPATLREWNSRSGISGFAIRAWRTTNAPTRTTETRPSPSVCAERPALLADLEDRVDADHQAGDEDHGAGQVGALAEPDAGARLDEAPREQRGGDADRDVDEEDPVPADRVGQHAAEQQADRAAGRGDEAVDAHRLRLLARLREHRHDHPEHDRRGQRAADALHEACADQHALALRHRAEHRGDR